MKRPMSLEYPVVPQDEERKALEKLDQLLARVAPEPQQAQLLVRLCERCDAEEVPIPASALLLFREAIAYLRLGSGVAIVPYGQELTTGQAAELLGVSRQHLVNLLKGDAIPYYLVGTHRRLSMSDILAYKALRSAVRSQELTELTLRSEEFGLYDIDASAILDARTSGEQ